MDSYGKVEGQNEGKSWIPYYDVISETTEPQGTGKLHKNAHW